MAQPPLAGPSVTTTILDERSGLRQPRGGQAPGLEALLLDQEAHHARGARGRQLPVRDEQRRGDLQVVGVGLDLHGAGLVVERGRDLAQLVARVGAHGRGPDEEEAPLGERHDHAARIVAHADLAEQAGLAQLVLQRLADRLGARRGRGMP
jgi:hypothetical protein